MSQTFKAACIQNNATPDVHENIETCIRHTRAAAADGARLICLPEYFSGLETEDGKLHPVHYIEAEHPVIPAFAEEARSLGVHILLGSLGVTAEDGRIYNRSYLLDAGGKVVARYNKIHMFDVRLDDDTVIQESATISPGDEAVLAPTPWGLLGLSVCYDLRFPMLYRELAQTGAKMLAVPAAFTKITGQAHWHVLNRARAIENGAFVIAPCQHGELHGGGECFGHSLIVAPWGEVLADGGDGEGYIVAEIDLAKADEARSKVPSLSHDRPFCLHGLAEAAE
ncbi:MAG: carbon-nitrogen hydrolase family protein [Pseudomonadota bacterium]